MVDKRSKPALAETSDPIRIGVIAEIQSIAGASTPGGAQIAADDPSTPTMTGLTVSDISPAYLR